MDRTYKEKKLINYKKNNACKPGGIRKKGGRRMRWMDEWCGEGLEELGCG
jgi:hypothetical protein